MSTKNQLEDLNQSEGTAATGPAAPAATVRVLGCPLPRWARWPAVLAFAFFLVKGLLWLALPALIMSWRSWAGG